jgi:ABC-type glycerol-3-phosphate transport system substrate-binding protein
MRYLTDAWRLSLLLCLVTMLAAASAACGDDDDDDDDDEGGGGSTTTATTEGGSQQQLGSVDVLGIWGAEELESFNAMVEPWGGTVNFTGTRDITSQLTLQVEGGNPPDVAIPAEIGLFQEFARNGELTPLSACEGLEDLIREKYPESFVELGTVDGELYGFFMKADSKVTVSITPRSSKKTTGTCRTATPASMTSWPFRRKSGTAAPSHRGRSAWKKRRRPAFPAPTGYSRSC